MFKPGLKWFGLLSLMAIITSLLVVRLLLYRDPINLENYLKIEKGMTYPQVETIISLPPGHYGENVGLDYYFMYLDGERLENFDSMGILTWEWFHSEDTRWGHLPEIFDKAQRRKSWWGKSALIGIDFNSDGLVERTYFTRLVSSHHSFFERIQNQLP